MSSILAVAAAALSPKINMGRSPITPSPQPPGVYCCWSKWGGVTNCGNYPGSGHTGECNTDWAKSCASSSDCPAVLPPSPSPTPKPPGPTPSPSPTPKPPGPNPPPPPTSGKIDLIGYYGNSGNAVSSIPRISEVHAGYNVIILTFASISTNGSFALDFQGPYEHDEAQLAVDLKAWRAGADKWGRQRRALVSIGGQNGHWPSSLSSDAVLAGLTAFMDRLGLDGLDIDLEGGAIASASSLVPVIKTLTKAGKTVTAAPEAAQGPLNAYMKILPLLTWVHPQFYNNPPNAVTDPYLPSPSVWPKPWSISDWQAESQGQAFWAGVLQSIGTAANLSTAQQGMLIPATPAAAGAESHWNIDKLMSEVKAAGVKHVGTWALAYDKTQDWKLAKAISALNDEKLLL